MYINLLKKFWIKRVIPYLLGSFVLWGISSYLFLHSHFPYSGQIVVHSHMSSGNGNPFRPHQEHEHSQFEYLYHQLNSLENHLNWAPEFPLLFLLLFIFSVVPVLHTVVSKIQYSKVFIRGPPDFSFINSGIRS